MIILKIKKFMKRIATSALRKIGNISVCARYRRRFMLERSHFKTRRKRKKKAQ